MAGTDRWNNGMAARQAADDARWKSMLEMINKTSDQTMVGYAIGRWLKGYFDRGRDKEARKKVQENKQRMQMGQNATKKAGVVPVSGVLGSGFGKNPWDIATGFHLGNEGMNPIALQKYGEVMKAQQPKAEAPVEAKTTTTEYTIDPNQFSAVQVAQGQPTDRPLNLLEMAAQVQPETINPNDIWKQFTYGRQG